MCRCHYGYKCRYLGAHMDADGKLIRDEEKMAKVGSETLNVFTHQLTLDLRSYKVEQTEFYNGLYENSMVQSSEALTPLI